MSDPLDFGCNSHACWVKPPEPGHMGTNSGKCYCSDSKKGLLVTRLKREAAQLQDLLTSLTKNNLQHSLTIDDLQRQIANALGIGFNEDCLMCGFKDKALGKKI